MFRNMFVVFKICFLLSVVYGSKLAKDLSKFPPISTCQCVPYYQCDDNNEILVDGSGIIDLRNRFGVTPCPHPIEVCCYYPNLDGPRRRCGQNHTMIEQPLLPSKRIVSDLSGAEVKFGEFPWHVAVMSREVLNDGGRIREINYYRGGGVILKPGVVITAAHILKE